MPVSAKVVEAAFRSAHGGRSTDDVVIDPELNSEFLAECVHIDPATTAADANWKLLNLRKSSTLGKVTTHAKHIDHSAYVHASQIAARLMEDRMQLTIDRVLCDPELRKQFDATATSIAPGVSVYQLRKAALGLRKARRLRPELIKRIADWGREIHEYSASSLLEDLDQIPRQPGIYIFRDSTGYLYVGEGENLRRRIASQLDHSDRKALAHYFWKQGFSDITVELHAFRCDSDARKQIARRAYESDLIAKRSPRFNIRP